MPELWLIFSKQAKVPAGFFDSKVVYALFYRRCNNGSVCSSTCIKNSYEESVDAACALLQDVAVNADLTAEIGATDLVLAAELAAKMEARVREIVLRVINELML